MKRSFLLLTTTLVLLSVEIFAQNPWPKTFLWRISGNGLSKNCFLYGTMHLQDRRLFNFSDSLFSYLETSEGYALEIDLSEYMDSLFQKGFVGRGDIDFDETKFYQSKNKKRFVDSLIKNVKERKDELSKKILDKIKHGRLTRLARKDMPTIMDAFFYGIARKQGKWLGGIEDMQDQLVLVDEFGDEVASEDLIASDKEMGAELEEMINIYIDKDLDRLAKKFLHEDSQLPEDLYFRKRNRKMAERMDSMSHIRSMFFAVGAAHLPGEMGVINLLRKKGYTVLPVYSSKVVDPIAYTSALEEIGWVTTEDEKKTFNVQMPGQAINPNIFGPGFSSKAYIDISNLTFFVVGSTMATGELMLEKVKDNITKQTNAEVISQKDIQIDSCKGIEVDVKINNVYFRMQFLANAKRTYILYAGGEKKDVLNSTGFKKFFSSFTALNPIEQPKQWINFGVKGFTVKLPGMPERNKETDKVEEGTDWIFNSYTYVDMSSGLYYFLQVRDIVRGHYMPDDSVYFDEFRAKFKEMAKTVKRNEDLTVQTFPAYSFEGAGDDKVPVRALFINRGSRNYSLYVGGGNGSANVTTEIDNFFNSFKLTDYELTPRKFQTITEGNFQTFAPGFFETDQSENEKLENRVHYVSYDSADCVSYYVFKTTLSPYYQGNTDSTFFEAQGNGYVNNQDSVLSRGWVSNGQLKGQELVIKMYNSNNLKKIRLLRNGDTLITLISHIPSQYIRQKEYTQFFEEFRALKENTKTTIFDNKTRLILAHLRSTDSTVFQQAAEALPDIQFEEDDLSALHIALLQAYPDDKELNGVRSTLLEKLEDLADSTTVTFIRDHFAEMKGEKEGDKFDLLDALSRIHTKYSYIVLKEMLLKHTPLKNNGRELSFAIDDSLELMQSLFPEILALTNNGLFAERIIDISDRLIDEDMISIDMLQPYKKVIYHAADSIYKSLAAKNKDNYNGTYYETIVHAISHFKDMEGNSLLKKFLSLGNIAVKEKAIIYLLRNNQTVNPVEFDKVASDKTYRRKFYETLEEEGKQALFPAKYLTQKSFAESDIYNFADEDNYPDSLQFLSIRGIPYKGVNQRFYLYRVTFSGNDDEVYNYLGIAGPYSTDAKKLETDNSLTGTYVGNFFDRQKIIEHFEDYIRSMTSE